MWHQQGGGIKMSSKIYVVGYQWLIGSNSWATLNQGFYQVEYYSVVLTSDNYLIVVTKVQDFLVLLEEGGVIVGMQPLSVTPVEIPVTVTARYTLVYQHLGL